MVDEAHPSSDGNASGLDRRAVDVAGAEDGAQTLSFCFYCDDPIAANQEVVTGAEVVAHRDCVRARLAETNPGDRECGQPQARAPRLKSYCCGRGHPYSGENLWVNTNTGKRRCRACNRIHAAARYERKRRMKGSA